MDKTVEFDRFEDWVAWEKANPEWGVVRVKHGAKPRATVTFRHYPGRGERA